MENNHLQETSPRPARYTLCPLSDDELLRRCGAARRTVACHRRNTLLTYATGLLVVLLSCGTMQAQAQRRNYEAMTLKDISAEKAVTIIDSLRCAI